MHTSCHKRILSWRRAAINNNDNEEQLAAARQIEPGHGHGAEQAEKERRGLHLDWVVEFCKNSDLEQFLLRFSLIGHQNLIRTWTELISLHSDAIWLQSTI